MHIPNGCSVRSFSTKKQLSDGGWKRGQPELRYLFFRTKETVHRWLLFSLRISFLWDSSSLVVLDSSIGQSVPPSPLRSSLHRTAFPNKCSCAGRIPVALTRPPAVPSSSSAPPVATNPDPVSRYGLLRRDARRHSTTDTRPDAPPFRPAPDFVRRNAEPSRHATVPACKQRTGSAPGDPSGRRVRCSIVRSGREPGETGYLKSLLLPARQSGGRGWSSGSSRGCGLPRRKDCPVAVMWQGSSGNTHRLRRGMRKIVQKNRSVQAVPFSQGTASANGLSVRQHLIGQREGYPGKCMRFGCPVYSVPHSDNCFGGFAIFRSASSAEVLRSSPIAAVA